MKREELDRNLDEWLDRAAADYGKSDIRPGFETRIIANLNSGPKQGYKHIPWINLSLTAAAILIFGIGVLLTKFHDPGRTQSALKEPETVAPVIRENARPAPSQEVIGKEPGLEPATARRIARKSKEIGRGRFLSSRLTDQEQYLMAYARIVSISAFGRPEESEFMPTEIPQPQVPQLYVPELKALSIENRDLQIPKLQNEEQL